MNPIRPELSSFSHGIDRVLRNQLPMVELPQPANLRPAEDDPRPQLELLLAAQTLDAWALAALRPRLVSGEILSPVHFAQVLRGMMAGLRHAAELCPRGARTFGRASSLLADQAAMRELLHMYTNVVVKA
ncbi:MAG: hypothetical protein ACRYGK_12740 [Janthinobacterium lividum]